MQIGFDGATGTLPPGEVINNAPLRFDRSGTLLVPNTITGTGGIMLDCPINAGTVVLSGANTFTGGVTVTSGALRITNSSALGSGAKTITMSNGTNGSPQLRLDGSGGNIDLPDTIKFTTSNVNGSIINEAGNNILRGNFTLASGGGDSRITVNVGTLTLEGDMAPNTTARTLQLAGVGTGIASGVISNGSATFIPAVAKNDGGTWTLSGANTYSGATGVNARTLKLEDPRALGDSVGATSIATGGKLDLNGQAGVVENITLDGGGTLANESTTPAGLASGVISLTAASSIGGSGSITVNGGISGAFELTKTGTGTLTLAGAGTHAATTVGAGRLLLAGSAAGAITVNGGTFQGSGAVVGNVAVDGGVHAPGDSAGIMTVTGNYSLPAAGTLQVEINGPTVGTQYDQVKVQGAASVVTLAGTLDLIAAPALAAGGTFILIDNTGSSPVIGAFANLPQAAEFHEDGQWWRISYSAGTGNDVALTRITPSPWQNWQVANFGANADVVAIAGDSADGDHDRLVNLLEYALGGNPQVASPAPLPQATVASGRLTLAFTRNVANTDLTLTVQASESLGGPWTDLARSAPPAARSPPSSAGSPSPNRAPARPATSRSGISIRSPMPPIPAASCACRPPAPDSGCSHDRAPVLRRAPGHRCP